MNLITYKIFQVVEALKANGTVRFNVEICKAMGVERQNFNAVKNYKQQFTLKQIQTFVIYYNVNANFIFKNDDKMFDTNNTQIVKKSELSLFSNN